MGNYRLTQAAKEDLRRIYFYGFETWGEAAADQYYNDLFDRFEQIAAQPYLYPEVDFIRKGYRRSVCGVNSIYYRIENDVVEIMAILRNQDTETAFDL
jgi:toxin ParE1/3/4